MKKCFKCLCALSVALLCAGSIGAKDYNIVDYGAKEGGKVLNTDAIQNLIDRVSAEGGGRVVVPEGTFLTGGLQLKSNVNLHLKKGAVLLGSTNAADYKKLETPGRPYTSKQDDNAQMGMIQAYRADNAAVTGSGTIDEQGREMVLNIIETLFHKREITAGRPRETFRPKLFYISCCNNFRFEGVYTKNSPGWGLSFELCHGLTIKGVKVYNRAYWNNDGIDIDDCTNVRITGCDITSGDDAICLKSYYTQFAVDSVYIADCKIHGTGNAIKFGSATFGGFRNITIKNIRIYEAYHSAIALQSVDGCSYKNVRIENVTAENVGNAICVRVGHRAGDHPGTISDVVIRNLNATISYHRKGIDYGRTLEPDTVYHDIYPSFIAGIPGYDAGPFVLENITVNFPGRHPRLKDFDPIKRIYEIEERPKDYPEDNMFGEMPCWGMYMRHAKGIVMKNVRFNLMGDDFRPLMVFDDAKDITIDGLRTSDNTSTIVVRDNSSVKVVDDKNVIIKSVE